MELKEYIAQAKNQLDEMEEKFNRENKVDPHNWPLEMPEFDWQDQEVSMRFSGL